MSRTILNGGERLARELVRANVPVSDVWDLVNTAVDYPQAVPILIQWLENIDDWAEAEERAKLEEGIARALTMRAARPAAAPVLIERFRKHSGMAVRWALGNAISVVADRTYFDEIVELIIDPAYGTARQPIVEQLGRWKDRRSVPVLTDLLHDDDVAAHAAYALGMLRAKEARPSLIAMASSGNTPLKRREARSALRRIAPAEA